MTDPAMTPVYPISSSSAASSSFAQQESLFTHLHYDVSVVSVWYEDSPLIWHALGSILTQEGLREMVIVDCTQVDTIRPRIIQLAETYHRTITLLPGHPKTKWAPAINYGIHSTSGQYLLILDPYLLLPKDALILALDQFGRFSEAKIAGGRVLTPTLKEKKGARKNFITLGGLFSDFTHCHRWTGKRVELFQQALPPAISEVPAISGDFMCIKRDFFKESRGFDENLSAFSEHDYCLHVNETGGKTLFIPSLTLISLLPSSHPWEGKHIGQRINGLMHYFSKNFNEAYVPGLLFMMKCIWFFYILLYSFLSLFSCLWKKKKTSLPRIATFLEGYKAFICPPTEKRRGDKYDLSYRQPILITDYSDPVALCILRRLLAADMETIALFHTTIPPFFHPKLTWHYGNPAIPLHLREIKPKTVIHTGSPHVLPEHLETFSQQGVERLICVHTLSPEDGSILYADKEKEIEQMCLSLHIDYTILHPFWPYGISPHGPISFIYRFIKRYGFFPLCKEAKGKRQPVHVDDIAIAAICLLNERATYGKKYYLAGNEALSYHDIIEQLCNTLQKKKRVLPLPSFPYYHLIASFLTRFGWRPLFLSSHPSEDILFSSETAKKDFGFSARPFFTHHADILSLE